MFGFIRTTVPAEAADKRANAAAKRGLSQRASEAIVIAVLIALLALGMAIRLWTYIPA